MADTSRTLAEVKALLADNNSGEISPQDLRDMVESIVNPAPWGGMWPHRMVAFNTGVISPTIPVNNTDAVPLPLGSAGIANGLRTVNDNDGWAAAGESFTLLGSDPSNSWSTTWPTGYAIMLPPGLYMARTTIRWTSPYPTWTYSPAGYVGGYLDQARFDPNWPTYPAAGHDNPGFYYWDYWNTTTIYSQPTHIFPPAGNPGYPYNLDTSFIIQDTDEPQPFILAAYSENQSPTLAVDFYSVIVTQWNTQA